MDKIIIAIDGHSSCGKSTIAKALAKKLNYLYVDSGAMYRAITLYAIRKEFVDNGRVNEQELLNKLANVHIKFKLVNGVQHTFLNHEDVELEIRSPEISKYVSQVAKIPQVRKHLVKLQQKLGKEKGVVMDGRDIGTVVFPSAEIKFYITADVEIRAKRRYEEMMNNGFTSVSYEDIKSNLEERDFLDSHRNVSPLIRANDAIFIDTSNLSEEEQLEKALTAVKSIID